MYVIIMLGLMALVGVACVPALLRKNCPACGARNRLDAVLCSKCRAPFSDED